MVGLIMPRWLIVVLVLIVGFILLSMAAFIALPSIMQGFLPNVGTVIVYEMEDVKPTQDAAAMAAKTVDCLNLRLNPGLRLQLAKVRVIEGNRIEVGVYGSDPAMVKKVTDIIGFTGRLEFRIVANMHRHKAEIEKAKNNPEKTTYFDSIGRNWTARWVRIRQGEQFGASNLTRERTLGDKTWSEVLVVKDPYDVTGDFLTSVRPGIDEHGKPCIHFSFNRKGGQLFAALTGDNLPDPVQPELKNQLGIILDGTMYSAPNILAVISDQGQITGNFSHQDVDNIVECLNAGSLPVNLRIVEERTVGTK